MLGRDTRDYLRAVAEREHKWITAFGRTASRPRSAIITKREAERDPNELLRLLELYISIVDYTLPSSSKYPTALLPTLGHPDISPQNIFVSPTILNEDGKTEITSIIDWSQSWVRPRYLHHWIPRFLDRSSPPTEDEDAGLPPNFEQLDDQGKARARAEVDMARRCRHAYEEQRRLYDQTLFELNQNYSTDGFAALEHWCSNIWHNKFVPVSSSLSCAFKC